MRILLLIGTLLFLTLFNVVEAQSIDDLYLKYALAKALEDEKAPELKGKVIELSEQLIGVDSITQKEKLGLTKVFRINKDGITTGYTKTYPNGMADTVSLAYEYDDRDRLIKVIKNAKMFYNRQLMNEIEITYDTITGRVIQITKSSIEPYSYKRTSFVWNLSYDDSDTAVIEKQKGNAKYTPRTYRYSLNKYGKVKKLSPVESTGYVYHKYYTYNKNNLLSLESTHDYKCESNGDTTNYSAVTNNVKYTLDSVGNWTEAIYAYTGKGPNGNNESKTFITRRTIKYE